MNMNGLDLTELKTKRDLITRNLQEVLGGDRLDKILKERELKVISLLISLSLSNHIYASSIFVEFATIVIKTPCFV